MQAPSKSDEPKTLTGSSQKVTWSVALSVRREHADIKITGVLAGTDPLMSKVRNTVSFRAPIEPAIRGVMKPLHSGVFGVSDRSLFTSF